MKQVWDPPAGTDSVDDHIAETSDAHDASAISVEDTAAQYTATDVEAALAEVLDGLQAHAADPDAHHVIQRPLVLGPASFTNLGVGPTDPTVNSHSADDLAAFTDLQIIINQTVSGGGTGVLKLQYATDDATWTDLGTATINLATAAGVKLSSWATIPAGAKSAPVGIRIVGVDGNGTEDHTIKHVGYRLR